MKEYWFTTNYAPSRDAFNVLLAACGIRFEPYEAFYERHMQPEERYNPKLALTDDVYTTEWLSNYFHFQSYGTFRLGLLHVGEAWACHEWGLLVAHKSGLAVNSIYGFGWSAEHFDHLVGEDALTPRPPSGYALNRAFKIERLAGTTAMLSFPGALIFGHWVIDIAGRLELLNALTDMNLIDHFLLPKVAGWMRPFLVAYGVLPDRIIELNSDTIYDLEDAVVPTGLTHQPGGGLPVAFSRLVFRRLAAVCREWGKLPSSQTSPPNRLVMIEHTPMTSEPSRAIENVGAVGDLVKGLGGKCINPIGMPLGELASALHGAQLVIGEDSSALHNIVFAPADLLVLESERQNLLHAGVQEACNKRVAFLAAQKAGAAWRLDIDALTAMLRTILSY